MARRAGLIVGIGEPHDASTPNIVLGLDMGDANRPDAKTRLDEPSLKLPRPAVRGLASAGVTTLGDAWAMSDDEMLALHGVGAKAVRIIRELQGGTSP
jgi:hypothetical protein